MMHVFNLNESSQCTSHDYLGTYINVNSRSSHTLPTIYTINVCTLHKLDQIHSEFIYSADILYSDERWPIFT